MRSSTPLLLLASSLALTACPKPPPDLDAIMSGALPLPLDRSREDVLDCARNDCADWYRTVVREKGTLEVVVKSLAGAESPPAFVVKLVDADGTRLDRDESLGRDQVRLSASVEASPYFLAVTTAAPRETLRYWIRTRFEPAPPPPPPVEVKEPEPQFETRSGTVLEVEGWGDGTQAVLIDAGQDAGIHSGLRGRLIEDGKAIGEIVIDQVYPDGSRARIEGPLLSPVTPRTTVEIDVPVEPESGPHADE